jgi:hypothetical protein
MFSDISASYVIVSDALPTLHNVITAYPFISAFMRFDILWSHLVYEEGARH